MRATAVRSLYDGRRTGLLTPAVLLLQAPESEYRGLSITNVEYYEVGDFTFP